MAADILTFNPDVVLVGPDQIPHLEFLNDVAPRIAIKREFKYELSSDVVVKSLIDPTKKMSKSLGDKHVLYLNDDYVTKLRKAHGGPEGRANLELIAEGIEVDHTKFPMNSDLKDAIASRMNQLFGSL